MIMQLISILNPAGVVSGQITLSIICITFLSWIITKLNNRFVNVSTKKLFFSNVILSISGLQMIYFCILGDVISLIVGNMTFHNETAIVIRNIVVLVIFAIEICIVLNYVNWVYRFLSKKSEVYKLIWQKLIENKNKELYCLLRDKVSAYKINNSSQEHNSYYVEEMITLYILYHMSDNEKDAEIFSKAAEYLYDNESYIKDDVAGESVLQRSWNKYAIEANTILRTPNNGNGPYRDNKLDKYINLKLKDENTNIKIKKRYDYLDLLKFIAIIMVVSLHVPVWNDNFISEPSFARKIQYAFRLMAEGVPILLTVNGFLLLQKKTFELKKHLHKVLKTFALLVFWAIVIIVAAVMIYGAQNELTVGKFLYYIFEIKVGATYTGILWYLQFLIGVYIFLPVLWTIYYYHFNIFEYFFWTTTVLVYGVNGLVLLGDVVAVFSDNAIICQMINFCNAFNVLQNGWFLNYFCLGGMIYHYRDVIKKKRSFYIVLGIISQILAIAFGYSMSISTGTVYKDNFNCSSVFMVLFVVGLFALTMNYNGNRNIITKFIRSVSNNTFGIYVIHISVLRLIKNNFTNNSIYMRVTILVVVFVLSYLISWGMTKAKILRKLVKISG